jgi:hypothetical protein
MSVPVLIGCRFAMPAAQTKWVAVEEELTFATRCQQ